MAAATLNLQTRIQILASENWDEDFEYQQDGNKSALRPQPRHVAVTDARKLSIASSTVLEDWDADENPTDVPRSSSAASQAILHQHVERQTDNWDDDFEDARNSPKKVVNMNPTRRREESWDDDMALGEETEDDSAEFGFAEKEEDRTVTAKSRRAALKRLSLSPTSVPPPMPPPLPANFLLNLSQQPAQAGSYRTFHQPFPPRSPTSSVFSVPTTVHTNQTYDHYYSSTTHLRPTSAFALLPPSPPIHKERERRRLRKKSRPKPQGTFELASLRGSNINASETCLGSSRSAGPSNFNRNSCSDDGDAEPSTSEPSRHIMRLRAGTPTDTSSADDRRAVTPVLTAPSLPQTPAKGTALLSRIGSVKKWGVRRKRASTTPSEVIADESKNADVQRTPRAKSSRASFHANIPSSRNSVSTPPPPQEFTPSTSSPQSTTNNLNHHRSGQNSNWFFRASSAGSPHTRAGGRAGGSTTSKGDRGKEEAEKGDEDQPVSRQRSESVSRRRSRSRTGRIGSYLNGSSRTDLTHVHISVPSTPSKLVKRKSLGFMQLRKSIAAGKEEKDEKRIAEPDVNDSPPKERYAGVGLGRATSRGVGACEGDASEPELATQRGDGQERRSRRKSFSRFLIDRDKENESNASSKGDAPEKQKGGSRGFIGSVRRISLVGVGKHKRTKSGSGILLSIGEGGKVPPLPLSSPLIQQSKSPSQPLYSLRPLPTSSQLSLRLPSPSTSSGKQPYYQTSSMHDLPISSFSPSRTVSGASCQTQASNISSILPMSSISSRSLSNTTSSEQQTPLPPQRKARTRSRTSEESARPRKSTSSRRSLDIKPTDDVSFIDKLSQYGCKKDGDITPLPQQAISSVVSSPPLVTSNSAPPLLPPIELQPPSPPRTITRGAKPESNPSNILTAVDPNSTSKLSLSASSSSVFFTPSSSPQRHPVDPASPNSKMNKLHVPLSPNNGKNPQLLQQSASLGRATTAGSALSNSPQDGSGSNGGSTHPRRNSLGDLKIPARISQAQVGLRRDLGMVKEFANNIEQLKELQRTYDALVVEIQSILEHHQAQQIPPTPTALIGPVLEDMTSLFPLKPKKRARSNTNQSTSQSVTNPDAPVTAAQTSYNELASAFSVINSKYRITWECADLLIELGGGSANVNANDDFSALQGSESAPIASQFSSALGPGVQGSVSSKRGRERAITLAGDESKPTQPPLVTPYSAPGSTDADRESLVPSPSTGPALSSPSTSWRTSTGRQDLSQRQLVLLREMLNNARAHANVADTEDVGAADPPTPDKSVLTSHSQPGMLHVAANNEWKWGDPKTSTVTLPLEDGDHVDIDRKASNHKRRSAKLGMSGLRDLLRALKRGAIAEESATPSLVPALPIHSTTSLSTESSTGSRRLRKPRQPSQRRRPNGPDSIRQASENVKGQGERTTSPYGPSFAAAKPSPRRPSLASIFRIGTKNRSSHTANDEAFPVFRSEPANDAIPAPTSGTGEDSSSTEEDWDRMDSASDLDTAAKALGVIDGSATVRGGSRRGGKKKSSPYLEQGSFAQAAPERSTARPLMTKRSFGASQSSIHQSWEHNFSQSGNRPVRLSNVEEYADDATTIHASSSTRSVSQTHSTALARLHKSRVGPPFNQSASVRSMPAHVISTMSPADPKPPLAMTPENIKPLLENAREVQARLGDCIAELRALVSRSVEPGLIASSDRVVA